MTRTIKASEVKPGMTIRWDQADMRIELPVKSAERGVGAVCLRSPQGKFLMVSLDAMVTVLAEAQPEEPTEFGARVVVNGRRLVRAGVDSRPWVDEEQWDWWTWEEVCSFGPVQVIPDQGWTVPDDTEQTPEVPDQIEEWPEEDKHLRHHKWKDSAGVVWSFWNGKWGYQVYGGKWCQLVELIRPFRGPWTRVPHA